LYRGDRLEMKVGTLRGLAHWYELVRAVLSYESSYSSCSYNSAADTSALTERLHDMF
jgi:hypothetical protein